MLKINSKNLLIIFTLSLVITSYLYITNKVRNIEPNSQINSKNCLADDCLLVDNLEYPAGVLSDIAKIALEKAIIDEYAAYSTYDAVIKKFGNVRPFSMIINAEDQHIAWLKSIYDKYAIDVPANKILGTIKAPTTLQEACQIGVDAEITNGKLYSDELIPMVEDYEDITSVFHNLMDASLQKHLPAFEKCN